MIKELALKIGGYLDDHKCKYYLLRFLIILTSLASLIYQIVLSVRQSDRHQDYRIEEGHYLIRKQPTSFRGIGHIDSCCQYFWSLDERDAATINGSNILPQILTYFFLIFGSSLFSIWATFLTLKGRYGTYVTVTVSGMLLGQFSLIKAVVKYGEDCIECSNLHWLLIKPELYPLFGIVIFALGMGVLSAYFWKDLHQNKIVRGLWIIALVITVILWVWCNLLVMINSPLGIVLLLNTVMDLLCLSQAYYQYDKIRSQEGQETCKQKLKHLCHCRCPCS